MATTGKIPEADWTGALKFALTGTAAALLVSALVNYLLLFSDALDPFSRSLVAAVAVSVLIAAPLSFLLFVSKMKYKQAKRELTRLSTTDRVTSFLNVPTFSSLVDRRVKAAPSGESTFLLVEIERLRALIMDYGRAYGEEAERLIAGTIRISVRAGDLVGRTGEGQFGILLQNVTEADAVGICQRIRDAISQVYFAPAGDRLRIEVHIAGVNVDAPTDFAKLFRMTGQHEECIVIPGGHLADLSRFEQ
ncbi:GGDEF domain-containing protein [Ollibium composti]|uniref:GGDEF domain-containing protein n=1 Tax=Ollibium composti TaxID=2675109 RepID=A0ABY2Q1M3_9HYPH|nr:GGDEF domain-containing protein [Mesorhizobium composti]THF54388.1 GGDEF domain-containing protein [Mesorhizobium composti]